MIEPEAPPAAPPTLAMQEALRGLLSEITTQAATPGKVDSLVLAVNALTARLDQHLRESAEAEQHRIAQGRELAELRLDVKRLADAKVAAVAVERERLEREARAAAEAETRWKGRAAPIGAFLVALALLVERLLSRLGGQP